MQSNARRDPANIPRGSADEERTRGERPYLEVLSALHRTLQPAFYLEIGVRHGRSLELARCPAIGVDPAPEITVPPLPATTGLAAMASDDFFAGLQADPLPRPPDMAFIDGMHLFEYALRDFINIERLATPATLIVIDDIFPSHPIQAERDRRTRVWTGDVWKLHRCLLELRPDLFVLPLDTAPTGLLLVSGLDPGNQVLQDSYDEIVRQYRDDRAPPTAVLEREGVWPVDPASEQVPTLLRQYRDAGASRAEIVAALRAATAAGASLQ